MAKAKQIGPRANVVPLETDRMDTAALVEGLIGGDPAAACELCERCGRRINGWVWRLLGADPDHEDMVQQVYVGVLSSIRKLRDVDSFDAFVDSVTIRTVRKEIRRRRFKRRVFSRLAKPDVDNMRDGSSPLKEAHIRSFYTILDTLPADDRVVFMLRHLEGLSLEAIARCGDYSLSTAKRRLRKATRAFRNRALREPRLFTMLEEFSHET